MRRSDSGGFGFMRSELLPFLFVELIERVIFLQPVIARSRNIQQTAQMLVSFLGYLQVRPIDVTGLQNLWIQAGIGH